MASDILKQLRASRAQADARGVPRDLMLSRMIMIGVTAVLVLFGLVMVFSASSIEAISNDESIFYYVGKQAAFAAAGTILAMLIAKGFPYQMWQSDKALLIGTVASYLLIIAVAVMGTTVLGAKRWLYIGSFSMQPSEFVKLILVMTMAKLWYDRNAEGLSINRLTLGLVLCVLVPLGMLFVLQSDLGTSIIIVLGIAAVLWLGEIDWRYLVGGAVLLLIMLVIVSQFGYRSDRIAVWLNPWNDGNNGYGAGYQTIRSYYAFSEGGLFGVGLGNSREKFLYLPEAETDFIFSIIGEELGLVGCVFVIALFMVFLWAGLRIAQDAPDMFGKMLAGSMTVMVVGQAMLNMACATGLFPTTGKPLPFISSGGSSIVASLIAVGLILSVSYGSNVLTEPERRRNSLDVIRVEGGGRDVGRVTERDERPGRRSRSAGVGYGRSIRSAQSTRGAQSTRSTWSSRDSGGSRNLRDSGGSRSTRDSSGVRLTRGDGRDGSYGGTSRSGSARRDARRAGTSSRSGFGAGSESWGTGRTTRRGSDGSGTWDRRDDGSDARYRRRDDSGMGIPQFDSAFSSTRNRKDRQSRVVSDDALSSGSRLSDIPSGGGRRDGLWSSGTRSSGSSGRRDDIYRNADDDTRRGRRGSGRDSRR